jgi:hypothetical protein
MTVHIESVGLAAPGLPSWAASQEMLRGAATYHAAEMPRFAPGFLPPNERRRATKVGRLAFQSSEEAVAGTDIPPAELAAVFASSGGDTDVMNRMCAVLAMPERAISPTDFHNSVHNAAAGYWSIATHSRQPSTSLSAYDSSFAAGLMEAVSLCRHGDLPVLLAVYDQRPPVPLLHARELVDDFTLALVLTPARRPQSLGSLELLPPGDGQESRMEEDGLETLRRGNPAARGLPLLAALARRSAETVIVPYFERTLGMNFRP